MFKHVLIIIVSAFLILVFLNTSWSSDRLPLKQFLNQDVTDAVAFTSDLYKSMKDTYAFIDQPNTDPVLLQTNVAINPDPGTTCVWGFVQGGVLLSRQQNKLNRKTETHLRYDDEGYVVGGIYYVAQNQQDLTINYAKEIDFTRVESAYKSRYKVNKYQFEPHKDMGAFSIAQQSVDGVVTNPGFFVQNLKILNRFRNKDLYILVPFWA